MKIIATLEADFTQEEKEAFKKVVKTLEDFSNSFETMGFTHDRGYETAIQALDGLNGFIKTTMS